MVGLDGAQCRILDAFVDGRGSRQFDDRVRGGVVSVGRREIDDLEVVGDPREEREGAGRAFVIERHERIVEDEWRPPVTGDEADQTEPGREIDEVERALAEGGHGTQSPRSGAWISMSSVLSSTRTRR